MGFDALIEKVRQAEIALEARERQAAADWRQTRTSWRAAWTPGRVVLAGLPQHRRGLREGAARVVLVGQPDRHLAALEPGLLPEAAQSVGDDAGVDDLTAALAEAGRLLGTVGTVLPATVDPVVIKAEVAGGGGEGQGLGRKGGATAPRGNPGAPCPPAAGGGGKGRGAGAGRRRCRGRAPGG